MKQIVGNTLDNMLDSDEEFFMRWTTDTTTAKYRRILMTRFVAEAFAQMEEKEDPYKRLFIKTGCLMTIDGSHDALVVPSGMKGRYKLESNGLTSANTDEEEEGSDTDDFNVNETCAIEDDCNEEAENVASENIASDTEEDVVADEAMADVDAMADKDAEPVKVDDQDVALLCSIFGRFGADFRHVEDA